MCLHQSADVVHPYGYTNMRYVSSLISGAMIFCVGSGLSIQHGIAGLLEPSEVSRPEQSKEKERRSV